MSQIELKNICKEYGNSDNKQRVLDNVSFSVEKGEMIAIIGPSGSGKSTLLNILGMMDTASEGCYTFNDKNVAELNERDRAIRRNNDIGFVFQNFCLIDELTALENVKLNIQFHNLYVKSKISSKSALAQSKAVLESVGLAAHSGKYPSQLSGGQQQRVAIARAIVNNPELIFADEPTGALDTATTKEIMDVLKELNDKGHTLIIVTHNDEVAAMCDRVICIRDGKLED